jgi:Sulfotransferase domain
MGRTTILTPPGALITAGSYSSREDAMSLKVIGAGLGRTGTLSLKVALEELGFGKCYHMTEVLARPGDAQVWDAAARGEPVDWETLFRGYRATVDWPGCDFYREFLKLYPEAKVILTVRDPERWYDSARQTIYYARIAYPGWLTPFVPGVRHLLRMLDRLIWDGMFDGRFEDKAHAIGVFDRHNEEVKRAVPADRLLVFEVKEGWGPLCSFLAVPIPEGKPFPHLNDAEEFRSQMRRTAFVMRAVACSVLGGLALVVAWAVIKLM